MTVALWKSENLSDLADMCLGKMLDQNKNKGTYLPYLANTNVRWGEIELSNLRKMKFEPKEFERYGLEPGDIVMCEGGEPGRCAIWKGQTASMMIQKALHRIRAKKSVSSVFLYYALLNKGIQGHYDAYFTGAAIKHLTGENLAKIKVLIPPLSIQQKIARILSAYDDLIENNLKRIKLLEEMAQITYEEWFVRLKFPGHETMQMDFETHLPVGWKKRSLLSVADFLNGYAFKPEDLGENGYPVIKIKEIKNGVESSTPRNQGKDISDRYIVNEGDILFSWSASLEVVIWQHETGLLNQHLFKVMPNCDLPKSFLYLALKESLPIFDNLTTGATMKHIKRKELDFVKIVVPHKDLLDEFNKFADSTFQAALNLNRQIRFLKEARDILLPRLMTGIIDVDIM